MKNSNKNGYIILLLMVCGFLFSCGSKLKDPMKAPELKDKDLEVFLNNFPLKYGPTERTENIGEIFYSGGLIDGMKILTPRLLGEEKGSSYNNIYYAIIIEKDSNPKENTVLYFEKKFSGDRYIIRFTKLEQGEITRYQYKMNPIMLKLFPNGYFESVAEDIAMYEEGEPERAAERKNEIEESIAAIRNPGWPKDSIYYSILLLRSGVLDFHEETVGSVFYTGKRVEGVVVNDPKKSGRFQVITITSSINRSAKFDIYLNYDSKSQMSLIEKIEVKDGNKTTTATTFEEKYAVLLMLLPIIMNEGNLGN